MTDTIASNPGPDPKDHGSPQDAMTPQAKPTPPTDGWEPVTFPGQMSLNDDVESEPMVASTPAEMVAIEGVSPSENASIPNTNELIQLIQDLNQCNDALLLRVSELEEALERSQMALQAEVERNQQQSGPALPPPPSSDGPVAQQIAQLLSELDIANDGLRRTTIHNETLQADLEANRQRVAQLERECTLLQQRFGEKTSALQQAENTCRDLKSRLHRQQHYTLQFKAALEKCLNMAGAGSRSSEMDTPLSFETAEASPPPVAMPKTQQISPWSAQQAPVADTPPLTDLLRSLKTSQASQAAPVESAAPPPEQPPEQLSAAAAPSLWQELDRVAEAESQPMMSQPDLWFEEPTTQAGTDDAPVTQAPAPEFTEPSPWGAPLTAPNPTPVVAENLPLPEPEPVAVPQPVAAKAAPDMPSRSIPSRVLPPSLKNTGAGSPSPVVYPLRSQKKITSIASVELPSFGRAPRQR